LAAVAVGLGSLAVLSPAAEAVEIPASPLTVETTPTLNCAVEHDGLASTAFFLQTACGTLVSTTPLGDPTGNLYGPGLIPGGGSASPRTAFTPQFQSPVSGTGTQVDPFAVVTAVSGDSEVLVTQVDSYATGDEYFTTVVSVSNNTAEDREITIYRAADCFLGGSDEGFGLVSPVGTNGNAVACTASADGTGLIEQWVPLTPGSHYLQSDFTTVWGTIGAQAEFPDTCQCGSPIDNAAGLSWTETVPAGETFVASHLTVFSPTGASPVDANITITTPADGATYQLGELVLADYSCSVFGGDSIVELTGTVPTGAAIDTTTTGPHSFDVDCETALTGENHESVSYTVEDTTDPTIDLVTPPDGAVYNAGEAIEANYVCEDADLATCEGTLIAGSPIDTSPGEHEFTVTATDGSGNQSSVTHTYTVLPYPGVCKARTIGLLGIDIGRANPQGNPCVTADNGNIQNYTTTFGPTLPPLLAALNNKISLGLVSASTFSTPTTAVATTHVGSVSIKVPALGLTIELTGIHSTVFADLTSGCGNIAPVGASKIATLRINGLVTTPPAPSQVSIPLGVGALHFHQRVLVNGVHTQRAVFLDLPGTALDVVIGEASAGGFCPPPAP
jgi:hypothetical protein